MSNYEMNRPSRNGGEDDTYSTIKVLRARLTPEEYVGALKFHIYKYMDRHREEGGMADLQNANWYMREMMDYVGKAGYENVYPMFSLNASDLAAKSGTGDRRQSDLSSPEAMAKRLSRPKPADQEQEAAE